MRQTQREHLQAALALLLGPETDYPLRVRAARRLARQGPDILPLVLTTLSQYPEITTPAWPWWPPQYEHCSRLLLHLSTAAEIDLEELVEHPAVVQPAGPVLWTSVIEAASQLAHIDHEALLRRGLALPWETVRYAAAMALATRAQKTTLHPTTLETLHQHQGEGERFPVRLTAAYALLSCGESVGLDGLLQLMKPALPVEVRKGAVFILAMDLPIPLTITQRERLLPPLLRSLLDLDRELALQAAHALSKVALPSMLPALSELLTESHPQAQIAVLTLLEEIAPQKGMRQHLRQQAFPTRILPLCTSSIPELRRQACYTLAVCGGEYATAALGTMVLNPLHAAHIEAIESVRFLHGVLRAPLRCSVSRWLLRLLRQPEGEETQATALGSLAHLLWEARVHGQKHAWHELCQEIIHDGTTLRLIHAPSAWVRQRVVELLTMLGSYLDSIDNLQPVLEDLLLHDTDDGVRACVAYACQQLGARWTIPSLLLALLDADENVAHTALSALSQIATIDDAIVVYALTELTYGQDASDPAAHALAHEASRVLKKWQAQEQGSSVSTAEQRKGLSLHE